VASSDVKPFPTPPQHCWLWISRQTIGSNNLDETPNRGSLQHVTARLKLARHLGQVSAELDRFAAQLWLKTRNYPAAAGECSGSAERQIVAICGLRFSFFWVPWLFF
jgi:hypothetical protein